MLRVPFSEYAWPSKPGLSPFAHQKDSVIFLLQHKRAYNLSDLGTGKTLSHLWCADFLMINDKIKQCLIIGPLSTMQTVWASEIFVNFPHRRYKIVHGSREDRLYALRSNADFLILNHDGVKIPQVEDEIIKKIRRGEIGLIIIDELTAFKKHTNDRSKAMQRIARECGVKVGVHGLTGAPTPNSPTECFGQARVVTPANPHLPKYFKQFQSLVEYQVGPYLWQRLPNAEQTVSKIMQPAIRFKRDQCIDIPECQYITRIVPFTPEQDKVYKAMKDELLVEYAAGSITASNAAVKMMKLLQIAAGAVKSDDGSVVHLDCSTRDDELWDLFEEAGRKLVVFSAFRASISHLVEMFRKRGASCETINGDVDHRVRAQHIRKFQESDLEVLVIQPQSSAHGITLTAANVIVWHSLVPSGEIHVQANGRITRAGQTRKQAIYYLIGCKAEKRLLDLLNGKGDFSKLVLSLYEEI